MDLSQIQFILNEVHQTELNLIALVSSYTSEITNLTDDDAAALRD